MNKRDTILIVDDMEVNRIILRSVFEQDYNLLEAENGEQALVLLEQYHHKIAVVLLDLVMPVKDGYEVMTQLRERGLLPDFPVVVITAQDSADSEVKAFDLGASDIIMKPFEPHVVRRRVQNIIELTLRRLNQEELIAEQAAKLRESNAVMVDALSSIIEYRSVETGQHIQRIRLFTRILLEDAARCYPEFGLTRENIDIIVSASSMHDIGKIAIPDAILNKPGRLTADEFEIMKTHTVKGCEMLATLDRMSDKQYLRYAYNICRYHHERWDGRGYPDGLKGDSIPICAQVVGIADCYDALTTDRVYKKAIPPAQAFNMILNGECGNFSPRLLECFKNVQDAFAALSREYADGKVITPVSMQPASPVLQYNDGLDTLQMGQLKYFTLLRYTDSTVMEVDFRTGLYHMVYMPNTDFELLKSGARFEESMRNFAQGAVHPEDRETVLQILDQYTSSFFAEGLMRVSRRYRIYNWTSRVYRWYQATMLRIDTGDPHQRKTLIIWDPLHPDEKEHPAAQTVQTHLYDDATLSNLLGGIQTCLNDDGFTLIDTNDTFLNLLGYTRQEVEERFQNKFIRLIYEPDRERVVREVSRQLQSGTLLELEYRLATKSGKIIWVLGKCQLVVRDDGLEYLIGILVDITASKKAQEELRLSLERHKIIMEQSNDIIFEWDVQKDTMIFSNNFVKKFGYRPLDRNIREKITTISHIHPDDLPAFINLLDDLTRGVRYQEVEFRLANSEGRYRWCKARAAAQFDEHGKVFKAVGIIADIDDEKRASQALQFQAERDELTQLYNKRAARRMIESCLDTRQQEEAFALLIIDVDNFKQINDSFGHMFGDVVLREISAVLQNLFRSDDIISRIGGDEFLVLMRNMADIEVVKERASQVIESLRNLFDDNVIECFPSCSIGVSFCPQDGAHFDVLFQHSDLALYKAKAMGKNRYTLYDKTMDRLFSLPHQQAANTRIDSHSFAGVVDNSLVEQVFQKLYESLDLDQAIDSILEMIGLQFEVSRTYIFEDSEDGESYFNTYEWCNEGIQPQKSMLQHGSYTDVGGRDSYQALFNEQGVFYCTDIEQLPPAIKELMDVQGIKSILQCAIRDAQGWYGFIGFDDCVITRYWTKEQINALAFTSKLLSIFLLKKRAQDQALRKAEDLRMVLDHQNAWIYVVDADTYQLRYINAKTHVIAPDAREGMRCYQAFFGRSTPCPICPMKIDQPIEMRNPRLNVWVMVDAVPMRWEDEASYLLTCYDITTYKKKLGEEQNP